MNLEDSFSSQSNNLKVKAESFELENKRAEREKDLSNFCEKGGNSIVFLKSGSEQVEKINLSDAWQNLDEEEREAAQMILDKANLFLHSPIFTDSFHEDHRSRRNWENDYLIQNAPLELLNYYQSNRFNLNLLSLPFFFRSWAEALAEDGKLSEDQKDLVKKINDELFRADPENLTKYGMKNDDDKYQIVVKLEKVFEDMINLLGDK